MPVWPLLDSPATRSFDQIVDMIPCRFTDLALVGLIPVRQYVIKHGPGRLRELFVGVAPQLCYDNGKRVPLYESATVPMEIFNSFVMRQEMCGPNN